MSKPYLRPIPFTWWNKNNAYRIFMLREISSVFVALFVLELLCFVLVASKSPENFDKYVEALKSPGWIVFHVVVLGFSLLHSITWFNLTPKVLVVRKGEEKLPDALIAGAHYLAWIVVSIVIWMII